MKKILFCMLMALPFVFTSCSKDDDDKVDESITLGKNEYKMNFKDKVQLEATSNLEITYKTENDYVATVSESGLITGGRVGKTEIILNNTKDTKKVNVIIEPKSDLYPEPEFPWGETKANLIKKLGQPFSKTSNTILYNNYSSKAPYIVYLFDGSSDNSKLEGISVIVKSSYTEKLGTHLVERYLMGEGSGKITLIGMNSNKKENATLVIAVQLSDDTDYWMVVYTSNSTNSLKSLHQIENVKEAFHIFDQIRIKELTGTEGF